MNNRILFVDDDPNLLAALSRSLRKLFTFDTALSGAEALQKLDRDGPYAVVVADQTMPGMNGVELLETVREVAPDILGRGQRLRESMGTFARQIGRASCRERV